MICENEIGRGLKAAERGSEKEFNSNHVTALCSKPALVALIRG